MVELTVINVEMTFLVSASLLKCFLRRFNSSSSRVTTLGVTDSTGAGELRGLDSNLVVEEAIAASRLRIKFSFDPSVNL